MEIKEESPFPTVECTDNDCSDTRPKSSRGDLCTTCENYSQIFGATPSEHTTQPTVTLEEQKCGPWVIKIEYGNGESERRTIVGESLAKSCFREYKSAAKVAH